MIPSPVVRAERRSVGSERAGADRMFEVAHRGSKKPANSRELAGFLEMVGVARIELATPAMSTQCSTTELHAHKRRAL